MVDVSYSGNDVVNIKFLCFDREISKLSYNIYLYSFYGKKVVLLTGAYRWNVEYCLAAWSVDVGGYNFTNALYTSTQT